MLLCHSDTWVNSFTKISRESRSDLMLKYYVRAFKYWDAVRCTAKIKAHPSYVVILRKSLQILGRRSLHSQEAHLPDSARKKEKREDCCISKKKKASSPHCLSLLCKTVLLSHAAEWDVFPLSSQCATAQHLSPPRSRDIFTSYVASSLSEGNQGVKKGGVRSWPR